MNISILVIEYNEVEGIKKILPQIKKEWYNEILIVDGGSTDGSIQEAQRLGYKVYVQREKGLGPAFGEGLKLLTGDIVVVFFPDGNCVPGRIPLLTEKIKEGFDIAMVSRYLENARSYDDDPVTAFGNWVFTGMVNLLFRSRTTDLLYNYRAYRKEVIDTLKVGSDNAWGTQLFLRAVRNKLKIVEIPGDEPPRIGGKRKMVPLRNGLTELFCICGEFFRPES